MELFNNSRRYKAEKSLILIHFAVILINGGVNDILIIKPFGNY